MREYNYVAKTKDGELQKGNIEAESENAAAKILLTRDLAPITITTDQGEGVSFFNKVSLKNKVLIARQLATMINSGLPISQSLKTLQEQVSNKKVKKILEQVASDVEGGSQLSASFSRFPEMFTPLDLTLVSSGEKSGSLDKSLKRLADQLEKEQSLLRKVRGALIYPAFIVVVVIGVLILMVVYVMPQMEGLYSSFNAKLPLITRIMIAVSHFLSKFMPIVILLLIASAIYIRYAIKRPKGRKIWDSFKLRIYGLNILLKKVYMVRFSRTLAGLVASGVPLLEGLSIVSKSVGNVIYQESIQDVAEKVKSGVALSEPLKESPLYPPVVPQMIAVGEQTGELDNMLENLSNYFEEEVDNIVKNLSGLIEPVMIVVLGGIIAVLMIAVMMPIYGLGNVLFKR